MAGGSLFIAPLADRFGRRALIIACLVLITTGMLLSAATTAPMQLAAMRALTGLGIGGMLASLNVITGEYSTGKWRSAAISVQVTGYPIGATIGGIIAGWLMANYGWRSVFAFGGIVSGLLVPVVMWSLPESLDYLLAKRPANALSKLNSLLRKMGRAELEQLPPASEATSPTAQKGMKSLFIGQLGRSTLLIWTSFFMLMLCFYFVLSWTPRLLVAAGMSTQQGVTGGVLLEYRWHHRRHGVCVGVREDRPEAVVNGLPAADCCHARCLRVARDCFPAGLHHRAVHRHLHFRSDGFTVFGRAAFVSA